jgi:hypothetical protein
MEPELTELCIAGALLFAAALALPGRLRSIDRAGPLAVWKNATGRRMSMFEVKVFWTALLLVPPLVLGGMVLVQRIVSS